MRHCECARTWYAGPECKGIEVRNGRRFAQSCPCPHCYGHRQAVASRGGQTNYGGSDVDEFVVEAILQGERMRTTRGERKLVVLHMASRGLGPRAISKRLGVSERTIQRDLEEHRAGDRL